MLLIFGLHALLAIPTFARGLPPATTPQAVCSKEFGKILSPAVCSQFKALPVCKSSDGVLIPYFEKEGSGKSQKRVLVFGQIHGDEFDAGKLAARWIERLGQISPHNTWRIVPMLNPDGSRLKTRTNAHGVDLNRNFPTTIWDQDAIVEWTKKYKKNPRRYPGPHGASEQETQCAIASIKDFNPDIVVSIHSPYGLLDFDGPRMHFPKFKALPWHELGTFAGSLGRYMWIDRKIPVLTVELAPSTLKNRPQELDRLEDLVSLLVPEKHIRQVSSAHQDKVSAQN